MIFSLRPSANKLKELALHWPTEKTTWTAITMNQESFADGETSWCLESHEGPHNKVSQLKYAHEREREMRVLAFKESREFFSGKLENTKSNREYINDIIHHQFINCREQLVTCGLRAATKPITGVNEGHGHEWLRVTFMLLKKALEEVEKAKSDDSDEVVQGLLFCGNHPTKGNFTFRLRVFNLDIEAVEDESCALRVIVYDKKKAESFDDLTPSLTMVFSQLKQTVLNEVILLLPFLSKTILI